MTVNEELRFHPSQSVLRIESTSRRVQQPQSTPDLVSLAMGEPNFETPAQICGAAVRALDDGRTHYSPLAGEPALREALAEKLSAQAGEELQPADVLVTQGGTAGLAAVILGVVDPGDNVVIPDPTYSLYSDLISMAGGECVPVPLRDDLHWDLAALEDALGGARMFVFCNPSNPTGIVHTRAELDALGEMLAGTGTLVLSDEAYSDLVYTPEPFTSALGVPSLRGRTVYCQTFSKSYAMTGWRVGYVWGPRDVIAAASRVHATFNGSVGGVNQFAALAALRTGEADVRRMLTAYRRRRALMLEGLAGIPGLAASSPEGAFYLFPRYDADIPSSDLVGRLRSAGVAVRPGSEFGAHGEQHIRLSYAASEEEITEGIKRLAAGLSSL
ncbi:pyridoxal phosphate-dependent aminotransferase [Sinomonas terrae]|uniref:Aminotransferase class I/II-fold pyridoxal phosphate-dependent enzyme n=1 Tax=Sinomonas terrae TaxID=2908838 RepID=A0ABS9U0C8_9MICC|nr:aminotransferase class I/II-fold pyridoxal phosphate-dependent enzyme [Sinomonas terrae]MCH6470163.1 aminotransferase class I/II-fold pyridoxal phosphate-dependent enzyme [Sinomonas terrae]